jgi:hypothetical protein
MDHDVYISSWILFGRGVLARKAPVLDNLERRLPGGDVSDAREKTGIALQLRVTRQ